jgi:Na+/H+ antiporter NhaD/arsenite permease-like protein
VTPRRSSEYAKRRNLMLLAVAYSASIGGTGVITGTPSNLIILEVTGRSLNRFQSFKEFGRKWRLLPHTQRSQRATK